MEWMETEQKFWWGKIWNAQIEKHKNWCFVISPFKQCEIAL